MDGARSTHDWVANPKRRRANVEPTCNWDDDNTTNTKKTPLSESANELYRQSDRRLSDPYGSIIDLLDRINNSNK
jgi:hypothetical protein